MQLTALTISIRMGPRTTTLTGRALLSVASAYSESVRSFLDLGCAGGRLVPDFIDRGHDAVGPEGSDFSLRTKRAEWSVLPDRLLTCDISKRFRIRVIDDRAKGFHVISAWDVLEHLPEQSLATFLSNVIEHLKPCGLFTGTVSTRPAKAAPDGGDYHATVRYMEWWTELFRSAGLHSKIPEPFALRITLEETGTTTRHIGDAGTGYIDHTVAARNVARHLKRERPPPLRKIDGSSRARLMPAAPNPFPCCAKVRKVPCEQVEPHLLGPRALQLARVRGLSLA